MKTKLFGILVCTLVFASTICSASIIKNNESLEASDTDTLNPPWDYYGWHDEGSTLAGGHDYKWSLGSRCNWGKARAWAADAGNAFQDVRMFHTCEIGECYTTPYSLSYDFGFHYSYEGSYECEVINLYPPSDAQVYDKIKIIFKLEWMDGDQVRKETKTKIIHEDTRKNNCDKELVGSDVYYIRDVYLPAGKNVRLTADLYLYVSVVAIGFAGCSGDIEMEGCLDKIDIEYDPPNRPPNKPNTPSGTRSGETGNTYTYSTSTTDPDGDSIEYWFDWDDGKNSGWTTSSASHTWNQDGTYDVRVKAKDSHGKESEWSDSLRVSMPKYKARNTLLHSYLIEKLTVHFPLLEYLYKIPFLKNIVG